MLARNASLLALAALVGSAFFVVGCAKPATVAPPPMGCSSGQMECNGSCANVQTDNQNCGACGTVCQSGQICQSGQCACTSGMLCGSSCVTSDATHCGSCSTVCPSSSPVCNNNQCSSSCSGQTQCGTACTNTSTDSNNCGTCGTVCPAGATCSGGTCGCSGSQKLCGSTCLDTSADNNNCGACNNACGAGKNCTNGACVTTSTTGTGGNTGSGGGTGTGGASTGGSTGTGGAGTGGTTGKGGTTGTGGSGTGGTGTQACATASTKVISDFEDGMGDEVVQGGRQGWWYVFADSNGGSQTPAASATGPVAVASVSTPLPPGDTCDSFALHSTGTGHSVSNSANYLGFGVSLNQIMPAPASGAKSKNPYDVSAYDGISFNIKTGSGTAPPVWFEIGMTESTPSPDGSAVNMMVDQYNTRGTLLPTTIGTTWTTVYVPFGTLAPRYLPAGSTCSNTATFCQAPAWDPKNALGLQFSVYPQFSTSTLNYDLWVDDVSFYTGTNGLSTFAPTGSPAPAHPFPVDGAVGSCTKPTGAAGKYLVDLYNRWKSTFVVVSGSSARIQRPENLDDTVSEGIGYGMLIAVNMGDKTLFDQLWQYAQNNPEQNKGGLMTWCVTPGGGGTGSTCSPKGGTATDADEDMAFALVEADKQWPNQNPTYQSVASSLISAIWTYDMDASAALPTGGSNLGTSSSLMNPSYFAPAYYRVFANIDKTSGHNWSNAATNVYTAISSIEGKVATQGLIPAWCTGSCSSVGGGGYTDASNYQYDAHRVPWRIGLDACWNSGIPSAGTTFLSKNAAFFASQATNGIGRVYDNYTMGGTAGGSMPEQNSMSLIGTAGVGAMAAGNSAFANTAWHFLLDASYTADPATRKEAYTYFNATVGLMTALTLSGNFSN